MSSRSPTLAVLCCALASQGGCKKGNSTVEEAFDALRRAAQSGPRALFMLLDRKTRWDVISSFRAQRDARELVLAHYPKERQAAELRRTELAAGARSEAEFFAAYCKARRVLEPLKKLGAVEGKEGSGDERVVRGGGQRLRFCREEGSFRYCGLRRAFEALKVRTARDLTSVRENAETYKRGR